MDIPYGKKKLEISIPDTSDILIKREIFEPLNKKDIIKHIKSDSVHSSMFEEIVAHSNKILIVLPDITRKSGSHFFLPELIELIRQKKKDFSIIFATGTHRTLTENEKKDILTDNIYSKYRSHILKHDPENIQELLYYGKTRNNTPILLNSAYFRHDMIITISSVSYHYFAGFGGGKKMIIPGIAGSKSATYNHKLILDKNFMRKHPKAVAGNLKENPIHMDLNEALIIASKNKNFFGINTILNDNGDILFINSGDIFISHLEAADALKKMTSINIRKQYDILFLSCGGFPKDINMVQTQKSIDRIAGVVKAGGKIFLFAECVDKYGNTSFENFFDIKESDMMFEHLLKDYHINKQTAYSLKLNTEKFDIYLYSSFSESESERMGFKKLKDIESLDNFNTNDKSVAVVTDAYNTYFNLENKDCC